MNPYLNIKLEQDAKVCVIGDIHEHEKQFDEIINKFQPSKNRILVSVGDLYDKGFGKTKAESIARKLRGMCNLGYAYVVQGNHEVKWVRKAHNGAEFTPELQWLSQQPLVISFQFFGGTRLTVLHGGVSPKHTWNDLETNTDVVYVRSIDEDGNYIPLKRIKESDGTTTYKPKRPGKPWHDYYDGRFGYIASGHEPQNDGIPKFYAYSCNLDTACYYTGILTSQVFNEMGLDELIQAKGPAGLSA